MNGLLEYIKETKELSETYSEIEEDCVYDNIHLFIRRDSNVLPDLPMELGMKLIDASKDIKDHGEKLAKIIDVLQNEKYSLLQWYELHEWSRIENSNDCPEDTSEDEDNSFTHKLKVDGFRLQRLRKQIYDKPSGDEVKKDLKRYRFQVERFVCQRV